jgi:hypothetical protein
VERETKTLQTIAVHALHTLLASVGGNQPNIKVYPQPDIGADIFILTFGGPQSEDSGNAEELYLALVVQVTSAKEGEFDCRVVQCDVINDPKEKTLSYELYLENLKRKLRKPPDEPLDG